SLVVHRTVDESGFLVAPWEINGTGQLMGSTATLMERSHPYSLPIELARGKVNQLRNQAADWRAGGLQIPAALAQEIQQACSAFGRAVASYPSRQAEQDSQQALQQGCLAAEQLVRLYADQVFQIRHQRQAKLDTNLGCRLGKLVPDISRSPVLTEA